MKNYIFFLCLSCTILIFNVNASEVDFSDQTEVTSKNLNKTGDAREIIERIGQFRLQTPTYAFAGKTPFDKQSGCSGFLLTEKVILTAAHCFSSVVEAHEYFNDPSNTFAYASFFRRRLDGVYIGKGISTIKKVFLPLDYFRALKTKKYHFTDEVNNDFAIVILQKPVKGLNGRNNYLINFAELLDIGEIPNLVTTLGYPGTKADYTLWMQQDCDISFLGYPRVIEHKCITKRGQSGSPLLIRDNNNGLKVAGVVTHEGLNSNFGNYFTKVQIEMIKKWTQEDFDLTEAVLINYSKKTILKAAD